MIRYKWYHALLGVIGVIIFYALILNDRSDCETIQNRYTLEKYSGTIIEKFIDKNQHNYHKIIIDENIGLEKSIGIRTLTFDFEISGVYDYLKIGDSITKTNINHNLKIKRNNKDTIWNMKFYCVD